MVGLMEREKGDGDVADRLKEREVERVIKIKIKLRI